MEMQSGIEKEKEQQLKDVLHKQHKTLVFIEGQQSNQSERCAACWSPLFGERYSCADCLYQIHKKCGEASSKLYNHPLHSQHPFLVLPELSSLWSKNCHFCKNWDDRIKYECPTCDFSLHISCAFFSLAEISNKFKHDAHPHPFLFVENQTVKLEYILCIGCWMPLVNSLYYCPHCLIYLHKKCAEMPPEIDFPFNREGQHSFILDFNHKELLCKFCLDKHSGCFYHCSHCNVNIHMNCVSPSLVIEDKTHHEHPFNLFWRQDPFICDACGTEGNYVSYICFICHIQVHAKCTSLRGKIKIMRHAHPVFHNYFIRKKELENEDCRICYEEVKTRYGSYRCLELDCDYIVHVNCAIQYILDGPSENSEIIESSITQIFGVNKCGDAIRIKHFSHEHCLTLGDKINENDLKYCDGCVLSISDSFYYCSECNFLLHRSCAELPRKRNHFDYSDRLTLKSSGIFCCQLCSHDCSGFLYECKCETYSISFCLKCANISDTIIHTGHKHLLFFDPKCQKECTACGIKNFCAYRCTKKCNYTLHLECITLPHVVRHKCDTHFLKLSYHEENGDPEQCYCDICEEHRDPNLWFYHCSICDTSAHPKCVLGKYPFIKIGSKYTYGGHPHLLTFVQNIYCYPECAKCGKPCQDLSLECAACSYTVHWECICPRYLIRQW